MNRPLRKPLRIKLRYRLSVGLVVALLISFYPAAAYAATNKTADTPTSTTQHTGPTSPPGADGSTYHLNESTGKWENDYYIWDPVTGQTTPKTAPSYSYNPDSKTWNTSQWQYNAASGKYDPVTVAANPPTTSKTSSSSNGTGNNTTNSGLTNNVNQDATTGNASVTGNTAAGDATTGNASDMANIINLLQSSLSTVGSSNGVVTFMANIPGNVSGNLMIDPASIAQNQSGSASLQSAQGVTVNNQNNGAINNAIVLNASSGNAGVVANTSAGNATSGNADAVANVVNMMNSTVGSGQSFVGVINVQGNLSGDILFPTGFLDSVLASNNQTTTNNASADINNANNQSINNSINAAASTGNASVTHNTSAGSATTGLATTKLTVMNLTGSDIIGNNALLVFVNVGGNWTGLIMNAPGATSATLGGGISLDKSTSTQLVANNTNNQAINNDISVTAQSGDATVANNTKAGNATSGNATATVNLANLINNHINLASWFGILFINIGGNWNGSLSTAPALSQNPTTAPSGTSGGGQPFSFVASAHPIVSGSTGHGGGQTNGSSDNSDSTTSNGVVLASDHHSSLGKLAAANQNNPATGGGNGFRYNLWFPIVGMFLGGLLLASDKMLTYFRRN